MDRWFLKLIGALLSDLEWIGRECYQIEYGLSAEFPELEIEQCVEISRRLQTDLSSELLDCKIIIREAFYALEPIVQIQQAN